MFKQRSKHSNRKVEHSLNFPLRRKELYRIDTANDKFAKRLMEKLPVISLNTLNKEYQNSLKYKNQLLKLKTKPNNSASSLASEEKQSETELNKSNDWVGNRRLHLKATKHEVKLKNKLNTSHELYDFLERIAKKMNKN